MSEGGTRRDARDRKQKSVPSRPLRRSTRASRARKLEDTHLFPPVHHPDPLPHIVLPVHAIASTVLARLAILPRRLKELAKGVERPALSFVLLGRQKERCSSVGAGRRRMVGGERGEGEAVVDDWMRKDIERSGSVFAGAHSHVSAKRGFDTDLVEDVLASYGGCTAKKRGAVSVWRQVAIELFRGTDLISLIAGLKTRMNRWNTVDKISLCPSLMSAYSRLAMRTKSSRSAGGYATCGDGRVRRRRPRGSIPSASSSLSRAHSVRSEQSRVDRSIQGDLIGLRRGRDPPAWPWRSQGWGGPAAVDDPSRTQQEDTPLLRLHRDNGRVLLGIRLARRAIRCEQLSQAAGSWTEMPWVSSSELTRAHTIRPGRAYRQSKALRLSAATAIQSVERFQAWQDRLLGFGCFPALVGRPGELEGEESSSPPSDGRPLLRPALCPRDPPERHLLGCPLTRIRAASPMGTHSSGSVLTP